MRTQPANRKRWVLSVLFVLVAVGGAVLARLWENQPRNPPVRQIRPVVGEASPPPPSKRKVDPFHDFVGSRTCRKCHEKQFADYASHPMFHTLARVSDTESGDADTEAIASRFSVTDQFHYQVERKEDGVFHHEIKTDDQGKLIYDQAVRVDYAVGSGQRGKTYLIDRGGLFFQSPITWYSHRKKWDLSPGYVIGRHKRFGRRVLDGCIACHSGHVAVDEQGSDRYQNTPILEYSIGCEKCHGSGRKHVEHHSGTAVPTGSDPIVNPAKLQPRRREAVCNQCHLHGEKRVLRHGRTEFDFRPGDDLEDVWAIFVRSVSAESSGQTKAVSQVEQMWSSTCFQKSAGKMGCISCHNPHSVPAREVRTAHYRNKCANCHDREDMIACTIPESDRNRNGVGNSCIKCHMPLLNTSDVPHTSQTDHRILKKPMKSKGVDAKEFETFRLFADTEKRLSKLEVARAKGLLMTEIAERTSSAVHGARALDLLLPVLKAQENDLSVLEAIGAVYHLQGDNRRAQRFWEMALKRDPRHESILERLALLCHEREEYRQGVAYLDRLFAINSWNANLYGRHAHMLGKLKQFDRGIQSAHRALKLNPSLPQVHAWLADAYGNRGDTEKSRHHRSIWKRLQPPP